MLNRFLMQAAIGYPLTVHGTGGQTRAFIHIQDTVRCIELAIANPPERGDRVQILNQMTETHRVNDLAKLVSVLTGVEIDYVPNPRNEAAENELRRREPSVPRPRPRADHAGRGPAAGGHRDRDEVRRPLRHRKIPCRSLWRHEQSIEEGPRV